MDEYKDVQRDGWVCRCMDEGFLWRHVGFDEGKDGWMDG